MAERTIRVNVRLSGKQAERFDAVCEELGMPNATVGAFAIAEYIKAQERSAKVVEAQVQAALQQQSDIMASFSTPEALNALLEMPAVQSLILKEEQKKLDL